MEKDSGSYILLFDGVCNLCTGIVKFVIKRDRRKVFRFAALQSQSGQALLKKFDLPVADFDTFVLIIGDKYYTKSTAVLHVLKALGVSWKMLYILYQIIPQSLRNFIYNKVAGTRYRIFGKKETCLVPSPEIKDRFLS